MSTPGGLMIETSIRKGVNAKLASCASLYEGENYEFISSGEFQERYTQVKVLGQGSFSVVREYVENKTGNHYAVKILKKNESHHPIPDMPEGDIENFRRIQQEISCLAALDHPNIVRLYRVLESEKKIYLVTELVEGGEVFEHIVRMGSFTEEGARQICKQIASALQYMHERKVVHRDIKPENLLSCTEFVDGETSCVKITDFGLSSIIEDDSMLITSCGTPSYLAPEIIMRRPYNSKVDMWSLGITAYILLCGFPPFYNDNTAVLYETICAGEVDFPDPFWSNIGESARDFVMSLIQVDPDKRLSAEEALEHPWLKTEASREDRPHVISNLKNYTAKRKWKIVASVPRAISRMRALSKETFSLIEKARLTAVRMTELNLNRQESFDSIAAKDLAESPSTHRVSSRLRTQSDDADSSVGTATLVQEISAPDLTSSGGWLSTETTNTPMVSRAGTQESTSDL